MGSPISVRRPEQARVRLGERHDRLPAPRPPTTCSSASAICCMQSRTALPFQLLQDPAVPAPGRRAIVRRRSPSHCHLVRNAVRHELRSAATHRPSAPSLPGLRGCPKPIGARPKGSNILYTGGFGSTELWHTLGGALEAVEHLAGVVGLSSRLSSSPLILVRLLFNEAVRRAMVQAGDNGLKANQHQHQQQLLGLAYTNAINTSLSHGHLSRRAAEELNQAFELDRSIERMFPDIGGVGKIVIAFLGMMQQERDASRAAAARLDARTASITDLASDNGVSAERIGTHTLLSKDSRSKEPFRPDAVMLAKHASWRWPSTSRRASARPPIPTWASIGTPSSGTTYAFQVQARPRGRKPS